MMFLNMTTHTKNVITIFAIFWCCVVPRFECCDPGKKMTLEEKVDGSNIVVLGKVLTHYAETRNNMFTAEIQVKCVLKDCGISVQNVVNISHAGNDSGGKCFDNSLTVNNTYYIFSRVLTETFWVPATEEIPEASLDATQLLTTCGLFATGPGPVNVCVGLTSKPCPTTTPQPPPTRRTKPPKVPGTTATVIELTSSSASGKKDDKVESKDYKVGAILGGVLGTLAAGGVAATIYFYVKKIKNKQVSDTEPQKDEILGDDHPSEIPLSKPPMAMDAIEKL